MPECMDSGLESSKSDAEGDISIGGFLTFALTSDLFDFLEGMEAFAETSVILGLIEGLTLPPKGTSESFSRCSKSSTDSKLGDIGTEVASLLLELSPRSSGLTEGGGGAQIRYDISFIGKKD